MEIKAKILLVEDDPNLGYITQEGLELQGFSVVRAKDGQEGLRLFLEGPFDLCLFDIMMPQKDGFTLASECRQAIPDVPIIFLTAKSLREDKVAGFRHGADDYVTKPFSMEELILRIQAVLRRSRRVDAASEAVTCFALGDYRFDADRQELSHPQLVKHLTYREAELLRLLCIHQNRILERETALKSIWQDDSFFNARSMDVYVSKLRKYLSMDDRIAITNVHGKGFRLTVR
jgi:DNA-binding response OmpR family regulator